MRTGSGSGLVTGPNGFLGRTLARWLVGGTALCAPALAVPTWADGMRSLVHGNDGARIPGRVCPSYDAAAAEAGSDSRPQLRDQLVTGSGTARGGRLAGRVAVVTGASSGIGRAVALELVTEGTTVVAIGRDETRLAAVAKEADGPGILVPEQLDLTDDAARESFAAAFAESYGPLDHLVHSAGGYVYGLVAESSLDDFDAQYAANVRAPFALTRSLLPALQAAGGSRGADVVVVNSSQGVRAKGGTSQYAATMHAMRAVADSLREEVNAYGIRVCTIHLGRTATPLQEAIYAGERRVYRPELLVQPEDVAQVVVSVLALRQTGEVTEIHMRPAKKDQ
jgi:NADP-dependent 3-hydroxy acid dehydrogenase YdfG